MASAQCYKPCDQTNHHVQTTTYHGKNKASNHNEQHSFTDKVKEMAHSAKNMLNHHDNKGHNGHAVNNHVQKPTANGSCTAATYGGVRTEKKKKMTVKRTVGAEGHCMPKMLDHAKMNKTTKKKNKVEKHSGCSSDSGSSSESESDNETCSKKN